MTNIIRFTPEDPQPLIGQVPVAEPYPVGALGPLRAATEAIAKETEAPSAMCAASVLAAAGLATQGLRDVETFGGTRPISIFLLTLADSGERKTTADRLAMRGVTTFEASLRPEYEENRLSYQRDVEIWERRRSAILKSADKDPDATRADLADLGPAPEHPLRPSIVTGSATMEGIIKNLPDLRASLGIMTDEGGLMVGGHSMKSETKLSSLATLAAMWDGTRIDRWRAGDGIASYSGRRFSSHLMIQPSAAAEFLADPLANGQGLLARFLTCRPASNIGHRVRMTQDPAAMIEVERFAGQIEALLARPMALVEGRRNELAPPVLTLDKDARSVLTDFARHLECAQREGEVFEDNRAFASKGAEHAVRLAGVLALFADPEANSVSVDTVADAITLATFYANEASRLQNAVLVPPHVQDAERMRQWLLNSWAEDFISAGVAAQRGPFKLTARARKSLQLLEEYGWMSREDGATVDGKPRKEAWRIVRETEK